MTKLCFTSIKIYKSYKKCAKNIIKLSFPHDFKIVRKFPRTGEHFISQRVYKVALIPKKNTKNIRKMQELRRWNTQTQPQTHIATYRLWAISVKKCHVLLQMNYPIGDILNLFILCSCLNIIFIFSKLWVSIAPNKRH